MANYQAKKKKKDLIHVFNLHHVITREDAFSELPIKLENIEARMISYGHKCSLDTVSHIKDNLSYLFNR